MENSILLKFSISQQPGELPGEPMNHSEIERTEILIEGEVLEIIINIEEESIFEILWCFAVRYPIEFVYRTDLIKFKKGMPNYLP